MLGIGVSKAWFAICLIFFCKPTVLGAAPKIPKLVSIVAPAVACLQTFRAFSAAPMNVHRSFESELRAIDQTIELLENSGSEKTPSSAKPVHVVASSTDRTQRVSGILPGGFTVPLEHSHAGDVIARLQTLANAFSGSPSSTGKNSLVVSLSGKNEIHGWLGEVSEKSEKQRAPLAVIQGAEGSDPDYRAQDERLKTAALRSGIRTAIPSFGLSAGGTAALFSAMGSGFDPVAIPLTLMPGTVAWLTSWFFSNERDIRRNYSLFAQSGRPLRIEFQQDERLKQILGDLKSTSSEPRFIYFSSDSPSGIRQDILYFHDGKSPRLIVRFGDLTPLHNHSALEFEDRLVRDAIRGGASGKEAGEDNPLFRWWANTKSKWSRAQKNSAKVSAASPPSAIRLGDEIVIRDGTGKPVVLFNQRDRKYYVWVTTEFSGYWKPLDEVRNPPKTAAPAVTPDDIDFLFGGASNK